ncbi:MAG: endonuclease III [Cytophagales bacterium]|nr:endonuclease III [Armatimonadota bacterium]
MARTTPSSALEAASPVALRQKAAWLCEALDAEYGTLSWRSHGEPMGALVMTILSQHTSDKNSERAYDNLRRAFPNWDAVRTAEVTEIADTIRSGGLADAKAPRIKSVLQAIHEKQGVTNLDFLESLPTETAREYLLGFHGVGPKTMACVLMFSLGRPVLPVDTHVFRVSHRLGLIPQKIGEAKAHNALEALLAPERVYAFHVHMIRHGRRVCVALRPRCGACVLKEHCDYFQSGAAGETGKLTAVTRPAATAVRTLHGMKTPDSLPGSDDDAVPSV